MMPRFIDAICDEFEASLRRGDRPSIEMLVETVPPEHRAALLYELLGLDTEYQCRRGQIIYLDELRNRFPAQPDVVLRLIRSFLWEGSDFAAVSGTELMLRRFRLKALIGRGGFGNVWLADDTRLEREVALKTPHAFVDQAVSGLQSALSEAAAVAKLRHPHILRVYEVAEVDGHWFMVTDYAPGGTLSQLLRTMVLDWPQVAHLAMQLAAALQCAHSHGVLHRDLKPSNILLDEAGQPLIADFGLARGNRQSGDDEGVVCGTRSYMAPEQAAGRMGSERGDVYSLGLILRDLATSAAGAGSPSARRSVLEKAQHLRGWLIAQSLRRIQERCCDLDPARRYDSAASVASDLERLTTRRAPREVRTPQKEKLCWLGARHWKSLLAVAVCGTVVGGLQSSGTPRPHPDARKVRVSTIPGDCDVVVVPLDPRTGDPLPERLEKAAGRTPVDMYLVPGDYLVVAIQNDQTFHEVVRHVPPPSETLAMAGPHHAWRSRGDVIELHPVHVRPFSPSIPLVAVPESRGLLVAPPNAPPDFAERLHVPGFLVASQSFGRDAIRSAAGSAEGSLKDKKFPFNHDLAMQLAEAEGLRLPTAAESAALLAHEEELVRVGVHGLSDTTPEWTASRRGAKGTGEMHMAAVDHTNEVIVMGLGARTDTNSAGEPVLRPTTQSWHHRRENRDIASRPVRSLKPRVNAEDFVQSTTAIQGLPTTDRSPRRIPSSAEGTTTR